MGEFSRAVIEAPCYRAFLRRETERALRLITTRAGPVQRHVVEAVRELVRAELARSDRVPTMPLPDLAYLVTRIAESFIYTDLISGEDPDADKAEAAVTALLRGASRPR
ncbi:QsdR family transcriptional regulator [Pseudonocardia benzenivorans]